jgi:Tfp pilus assembly PilM family ATPase
MMVNVDETRTTLSIVSRGVVQFSLMVPIGGDALTGALEKHFSVNNAEAKKIKEERGFVRTRGNTELFLSLMDTVSVIKDQISKLFAYWQTRHSSSGLDSEKIEKIILCGRDANLVGFDEYLSVAMKIPVEIGNVWQNAFSFEDYVPNISFLDSLDYGSAIGLALPQEKNHV